MKRRQFVLCAAADALVPRTASAAEVEISVLPQKKDRAVNYRVFAMRRAHQGAEAVRSVFGSPGAPFRATGVTGSASVKERDHVGVSLTLLAASVVAPAMQMS